MASVIMYQLYVPVVIYLFDENRAGNIAIKRGICLSLMTIEKT